MEKRKLKYNSLSEEGYSDKIGVKWLKSLAKKEFSKSKNLMTVFEFKRTSLWWWMEMWLYFSYAYQDSFRDIIRTLWAANNMIEKENPDKITFIDDGRIKNKVFDLLTDNKKIKKKKIKSFSKFTYIVEKKLKIFLIKRFFYIRTILRKTLLNIILKKSGNKKQKYKENVLFISKHSHRTEEFLNPVVDKLKDLKYNKVFLDTVTNEILLDTKMFRKKLEQEDSRHILIDNYISIKDIKEIRRITKRFKRLWNLLRKNKEFKSIFEFKKINIWELVEPQMSCFFYVRMKSYIEEFVAIENVIEEINPKVVVNLAAQGFDVGLLSSCIKRKIPSVIFLFGVVVDLSTHRDLDQVSQKEIKPDKFLIPTKTVVRGQNYKNALIKYGHYPEDSVKVTGDLRYDFLANKKFDKNKICRELGLNPKNKIILFGTYDAPLIRDRELLTKIVGESVSKIKDAQLLIKPHPNEKKEFYENIIKKYKLNAVVVEGNIFPFLYICDVLLMANSTIGLEAAILKKPFINMAFICNLDMWNYVKKGLALEAKQAKNLTNVIKKALYDEKIKKQLAKNRNKYVKEQCYKIDGKSSQRIADVIKSIINKR